MSTCRYQQLYCTHSIIPVRVVSYQEQRYSTYRAPYGSISSVTSRDRVCLQEELEKLIAGSISSVTSRDRVCLQEELEKLIAGFKDDLQAKRVEKQELHTKLQKLQVRAPGSDSTDPVIVGADASAAVSPKHQVLYIVLSSVLSFEFACF